ncbi:L-aspartate oxidase [Halosquirtibacter laminarini]|uniref:L-aspartate oxidase n=1 Tax=Halosquirtibacter laminarini TaxID=3374600 RepID=A0AC61NNT3_9BACT|nr:L-aspartate oxidase [Prolixibacteraceae bacterium]
MKSYHFDYIIVGSGLAGLASAYHASKYGNVALLTKSAIEKSNSHQAQGGIACVYGEDDNVDLHMKDTMIAGRELCETEAIKVLVSEGTLRVKEIIEMGMQFDTDEHGEIILGLEGGHSRRRILHAGGDATGARVTDFMLQKVKSNPEITIFERYSATTIIHDQQAAYGIVAVNNNTSELESFFGKNTILACGGISKVYSRSTNPKTATGDGVSMAIAAGVQVRDLEFIQFHPSALAINGLPSFLISEAVRGEGAYLRSQDGSRFMKEIHPDAELAPRDIVASAIFNQMKKDNTDHVFLSLKHLESGYMKHRFQSINSFLLKHGIDFTKEDIPIAPAAHYMVGGITTDLNGTTSMKRLYAVGEVASTGVMGANRLASNSLLECLVFSYRAINQCQKEALTLTESSITSENVYMEQDTEESMETFHKIEGELAKIMMDKVGIVRNQSLLSSALLDIEKLKKKIFFTKSFLGTTIIQRLDTCSIMIEMALNRKESRGGHIRSDYKNSVESYRTHSNINKTLIKQKK